MQFEDLAREYRRRTDEELLQLASDKSQLTSVAAAALSSELAVRGLTARLDAETQDDSELPTQESPTNLKASEFIAAVLQLYHQHFWSFFVLSLPAVLVSFLVTSVAQHQVRELMRHLPRGVNLLRHNEELLEMGLWNYGGFLASWVIFSFSFAVLSAVVFDIRKQIAPSLQGALEAIKQKWLRILLASVILFAGLLFVLALSGGVFLYAMFNLVSRSFWQAHPWLNPSLSFCILCLGLVVLSRFALCMPVLIAEDSTVSQSFIRSDEITEGKWLILASLLVKSLFGGYVAAMLPFWLTHFLLARVSLPGWFSWFQLSVSIVGVSIADPPMFIGFALLYTLQYPSLEPSEKIAGAGSAYAT